MELNRRDLLVSLAGVGAAGGLMAVARTGNAQTAGLGVLSKSKVFRFEGLPVKKMANGAESREVLLGALPTGETVGAHATLQPAGVTPNPAHVIHHSEILMVMEGTLEVTFGGTSQRLEPGGIFFVSYGTLHQVKNVGAGPVKYVVVAVGGDVKSPVS